MARRFELKQLSKDGLAAAHEKAERYRLLNEPAEAESICLDILEVEPGDQRALVTLFLALTDQLETRMATAYDEARALLLRIEGDYARVYYEGILCERRAGAHHKRATSSAAEIAGDWYRRAMTFYERAEELRPAGNDDALLRWNTCARTLQRYPELVDLPEEAAYDQLE